MGKLVRGVLDSKEHRNWLALHSVPGLRCAVATALTEAFGSVAEVLSAGVGLLRKAGLNDAQRQAIQDPDWRRIDEWLEWAAGPSHTLITPACGNYPAMLKGLADAPIALFVNGSMDLLEAPQIAVVGSRNPTANAAQSAGEFAAALVTADYVITSGMAMGIDSAAHRGALVAGGATLAVLGCGIDVVYPQQNRRLAGEIIERGALISEYPLGTPPKAMNFPLRNRIISGLSQGVLVVEAAARSGSLITARLALEQGREVFAIPGSIHNPMAKGCHRLIREGATLVDNIGDILNELTWHKALIPPSEASPNHSPARLEDLDEDYVTVLQAMGYDPVSVDCLVERTGLTPQVLSSMLLILELRSVVHPVPGAGYVRTAEPGSIQRIKKE